MKQILAVILAGTTAIAATGASKAPDERTIVHVLNRVAFGPRAGDVERVRALGIERYIDQQLHPERLPDAGMAGRLARLETLEMSSREIARSYEQPLLAARRDKKQSATANAGAPAGAGKNADAGAGANAGAGDGVGSPRMPDPVQRRANSVMVDLAEQKILRAVYSERQLQEVLTDFWFNHFNVDARKGPVRFMLTEYERDAIRPHVFGKFRDLLEASAKSPAMLFYLDNWMSADPNGPHPVATPSQVVRGRFGGRLVMPGTAARRQNPNAPRGLNENYARELMELHTLGVDGGYTQKDVTEVARAFTGWSIEQPRAGGGFVFRPQLHDPGAKVVLGHTIKAGGGESDGERVLDILATHPATARFIATKLARRFVGDDPPSALVDRAADRFQKTDGDLREVVRTILLSPEFLAPTAIDAKVKTPFEFVVSSLRESGAEVADARAFVRALQELGMPLYQCQPPTGYKDAADVWINTGALIARMNVATRLAGGDRTLALRLGSPEFQRR